MTDLKPHLSLNPLPSQPPRKKQAGFSPPPKRDFSVHSKKIQDDLKKIVENFQRKTEDSSSEIRPVLVVKIDTENTILEDELDRYKLTLLDENSKNRIYVLAEDNLQEFSDRAEQYSLGATDGHKNPRYSSMFNNINSLEEMTVEERLSRRVLASTFEDESEYLFDLSLWYFHEEADREALLEIIEEFVSENGGEVLDTYNQNLILMSRIRIKGKYTPELFENTYIRSIDFPPQPDLGMIERLQLDLGEFEVMPPPPDDATSICIIDSGIVSSHPFLGNAVGYAKSFPDSLTGIPHGHGTFVAGIALYGDVSKFVDNRHFTPEVYIFSARVMNSKNGFDDEKLIVTQMEEAIRYFVEEYNCRIFNISIGDKDSIFSDEAKPSAWAHILDVLVRDLDIIITVSTGNLAIHNFYNDEAARIQREYPDYLLNGLDKVGDTRILEPSTAVNVLTIGSLSHSNNALSRDVRVQPIASEIGHPSPFTRVGRGVNESIKPEICEDGGNMLWHGYANRIRTDDSLGVLSLDSTFLSKRLFATDVGTSYAAPKVAHLAAIILKNYPNASSSLIRALIASSAEVPMPIIDLFDPNDATTQDNILRLCGYGKPDFGNAIYSTNYRVTLIAEEEAELDTIQLYQIPVPKEFQTLRGQRRIIISLAYNAPVRPNRRDYLGIKMDYKLFRGVSANDLLQWYAERDSENQSEKTKRTASMECKLYPSTKRRSKGTLQKGVWKPSQNSQFENYLREDDNLYLLVRCSSNSGMTKDIIPKQPYSIAITLEHSDHEIPLYDLVQQRIQRRARARVRT